MRKNILKRLLASTLSLSVLVSMFPQMTWANDGYDEEALVAELKSYSEEYPDGAFAFYNSQIEASEGDGSLYVDIVRMGGMEGKASVKFKAIDVSAVYGKDYTLSVDESFFITRELEQDEEAEPIVDLIAQTDTDTIIGEEQPTTENAENVIKIGVSPEEGIVDVNENFAETTDDVDEKQEAISEKTETDSESKENESKEVKSEVEEESEQEEEVFETTDEEDVDEIKNEETKGLKAAWSASTDKKSNRKSWQEVTGSENAEAADLANEMSENNGYIGEFAQGLPGTEYTLRFDDGEYLKRIKVNLIDDNISETDEQVMFVLMDESGAELAKPNTAYLNITDNDENEQVVFSLPDGAVTVFPNDDYAYINVERISGIEKFASVVVGTGAISAEPDKDYKSGSVELIFPQGVTSKTVKVPIYDMNRAEDVTFAVAIDTESAFADPSTSSAAVTIKGSGETIAEPQTAELALAGTDVESDETLELFGTTEVKQTNITAESPNSGTEFGSYKTVLSKLDLRNATRIDVEYSASGSYEYTYQVNEGSGCKKKVVTKTGKRYGKEGEINVAGKIVKMPSDKTSLTINLNNSNKLNNQNLMVRVKRTQSGNNGKVKYTVKKVTVYYDDIVITMDNSRYAESNIYTEKIYEPDGTKSENGINYNEGNEILLGEGKVKGSASYTAKRYSEPVTFSIGAPSDNEKTTQNIKPREGKNVYLAGWQVYNTEQNRYNSEIIRPDDMSLETLFVKYKYKTNFQIRPVIYPYASFIRFNNSYSDSLAYTNGITDGKEMKVTMLDTLNITGVGINNSGYAVESFIINGFYDGNLHATGGTKRADNANKVRNYNAKNITDYMNSHANGTYQVNKISNDADTSKMVILPDCEAIYLDMTYTKPKIEVMYNPSNSAPTTNKEDGSVFYFDEKNPENSVDSSWNKPMTIMPVDFGSLYNINTVYSDSDKGGMSKYKTVWQDFTGDTNRDGQLTQKEQNPLLKYSLDRKAVTGDVFTYNPKVTNSLIYYYVAERAKAKSQGYIDGTVVLKDYPIFGRQDVTYTPINGATVTVDGISVATEYDENFGGVDGTGGNGYFSVADNSFIAGESHRVNIVYGALSTAASQNVNVSQQYVLDAYDTISVSNATKSKNGNMLTVDDVMYNDDANYTFNFVTKSANSALIATKAVLKFYRNDGSYVTEKEYMSTGDLTGIFECTFNPKTLGLPAGGKITVTFTDNVGTTYFEHDTGISLMQSLGAISLVTSFSGKAAPVLQVIGKVSSAFNFGWDGNLDDTEGTIGSKGNYSITTAEGKKILNLGLEFATEGSNEGKTKDDVKDAAESGNNDSQKKAAESVENGKNKTKSELAVGFSAEFSFGITLTLAASENEEHKGEWYFEEFMIIVNAGAQVSVSKSFVTPIGIPVIVGADIGADGQAIIVVEKRLGSAEYYMADLTSSSLGSVDLVNKGKSLSDYMYVYGNFTVAPRIELNAGVGVDGFNIKLHGEADFTFNFNTKTDDGDGNVKFSCWISIEILKFTKNFNLGSATVDLFSNSATLYEGLDGFSISDRDYLANRGEWNGASDDINLLGVSNLQEHEILASGMNPNADIQLAPLGDGRYIAVFLDDVPSRTAVNSTAVYYSIYNGSEWEIPKIIDDDGTIDDSPSIHDLENGKLFITWSSASKVFGDDPSMLDVLNSRDIKGVFVNKFDGKMGKVINVTYETDDDKYADNNPHIAYYPKTNQMMIYYTKSEYTATGGEEGVYGDVIYPYDTFAYGLYDMDMEEFIKTPDSPDGDWYGQILLDVAPRAVVNETLDENGYWTETPTFTEYEGDNDPVVTESDVISYNGLSLLAYIIDYDGDKGTTSDRDVFMQIYNFDDRTFSYPIMITSNNVEERSLHFERIGDAVTYLSYISDGSVKMLDISSNVSHPDVIKIGRTNKGTRYYYFDKTPNGGYIPEIIAVQATGGGDYSGEREIVDFDIKSGEKYFYIMFTERKTKLKDGIEPGSSEAALRENNLVETQVYMTRYDIENAELTNPVAVTEEEGANYNNFAFAVEDYDGGFVAMATKSMSTVEEFEGEQFSTDGSKNSALCSVKFTSDANVTLKNPNIDGIVAGGLASASFEVYNGGLDTIDGLGVEINDADGNAIDSSTIGLLGGEKQEVTFGVPVAEDANGCGFTAIVKDSNGNELDRITYSDSVARSLDVISFDAQITQRGIVEYNAVVKNNMLVNSGEKTFTIKVGDTKLYTTNVESLNQGETKTISGTIDFDYDKYFASVTNADGAVRAEAVLIATAGNENMTDTVSLFASAEQMARMNAVTDVSFVSDGEVAVAVGRYCNLQTAIKAENYNGRYNDNNENEIAAQGVTVKYTSDNEEVAKVYADGYVEGISEGTATITALLMPSASRYDGVDYVSDYPTLPNEAIKTYTINVNVEPAPVSSPGGGSLSGTSYTVNFETNGGTAVKPLHVEKNTKLEGLEIPEKDGYIFSGWYTDKALTENYDFDTIVTKNITLYAKWTADETQKPNDDNKGDNKPQTEDWKNPFIDVKENDWFFENVKYANQNGLMSGVSNTEFAPNLTLTRGMLVTILYRMAGEPTVNKSIPFADVTADSYYANAVIWAQQNGIVSGISETEFAPNENITREQIAVILYRYAKVNGYDVSVGKDTNILSYTDFDEISDYAIEAMQYAVGIGLITGRTESTLNPKDNATRAEIAAILQRFIGKTKTVADVNIESEVTE